MHHVLSLPVAQTTGPPPALSTKPGKLRMLAIVRQVAVVRNSQAFHTPLVQRLCAEIHHEVKAYLATRPPLPAEMI